jgi:hypothetical protein
MEAQRSRVAEGIREYYRKLAKLGIVTDDFENLLIRLLNYYKDRDQKRRYSSS